SLYNTSSDYYAMKIHKLEDRPSTNLGTPHTFRIIDREIHFEEVGDSDILKIGSKVKELRKAANMTQAELAARLNMTSGAISQIENDLITPSLNTLVHIASFFKKQVEFFINTGLLENPEKGYKVLRKKDSAHSVSGPMKIQRLFDDRIPEINPYFMVLGGNQSMDGPIMLHKGRELIVVVNGALNLTIEGEELLFRKGDSIILERSFIERWSNHGKSDCEFIYIQY
ncbi:MAG TPA: XRE family transcriptional regulator, partial [Spirochaetes bacterium]|nr:XRE family transcriptional regulator [Spirochaetota bacterium]